MRADGAVRIQGAELRRLSADPAARIRHELFDLVSDLPEALSPVDPGGDAAADRDGSVWSISHSGVAMSIRAGSSATSRTARTK